MTLCIPICVEAEDRRERLPTDLETHQPRIAILNDSNAANGDDMSSLGDENGSASDSVNSSGEDLSSEILSWSWPQRLVDAALCLGEVPHGTEQ